MTGDSHDAITRLQNLEPLLKQPFEQARWNPPMYDFWMRSRNYFALGWQELAKPFPADVMVRYNAGRSLSGIHEYADAVVQLRAATESQPVPESLRRRTFVFLGAAVLNSKHAAEAEVPLRAVLKQSPPDFQAYCVLSEVYKRDRPYGGNYARRIRLPAKRLHWQTRSAESTVKYIRGIGSNVVGMPIAEAVNKAWNLKVFREDVFNE